MPGNVLQDKNKPDNLSVEIGLGGLLNNASLSGNYNKTDQEQINRASVGAGTVIIRSAPARGLEGLNRDIAKARELTKDEKVNVTVYVDSTSLKESASGFEGTLEGVGKLGENLQQVVREWKALTAALPGSAKHLGQAGLDAMQAMLRNGASSEQVAQLMNDPEFQRIITGFASIGLDGEPVGETYVDGNGRHVVEITRPGDASLLLTQMCRLYEYVEALPYKDEISAALFGVQAVCSGPLGLIKNLLGGEVMDAATQNLAAYFVIEGVYKGEEGAKVFPQDQLTSEVKATKFFLDLGLGVGVGALSGSIKFVGKEVIPTIPSKRNGQLLGANGVFLPESKTIIQKANWRADIENTNPGKRPASLHLQIAGDSDKYYYNPANNYFYTKDRSTGMFVPVSASRNKEFINNRDIISALQKALHYLGE